MVESKKVLSPVQFGTRKGRTALDALLLKRVTMNSVHLFRLNGALLNNDAQACYDRMILELTLGSLKTTTATPKATQSLARDKARPPHHQIS
eukprot:12022172-Ditylum_brightwellii.AAC.1